MPRPLTLLPIQKCQDTVEALREQLTSYSIQVCSTCILQDEESHHWADPKPFYEVKCFPEIYLVEFSSSPKDTLKKTFKQMKLEFLAFKIYQWLDLSIIIYIYSFTPKSKGAEYIKHLQYFHVLIPFLSL